MIFSTSALAASILLLTSQSLAAPAPEALSRRQFGGRAAAATRDDVVDGKCAGVTVIYARGTTERGNVGAIAGPPFFDALEGDLAGDVAVQGVEYPANIAGFLQGGDAEGANTMADLVGQALTACPNTKIVLSGYSQGAQVARKAAEQLPANQAAAVSCIVLFGDPNNGDAFPGALNNNVMTFCNRGDLICDGQAVIRAPHLAYGSDGPAAAQFVTANV